MLVIAHRLSTIRDAQRICVISGGQLAEQGSHEELMATKGLYAGLVARQLAGTSSSDGRAASQGLSLGSFSSCPAGGSLSDLSEAGRQSVQEAGGRSSLSSSRSSTGRDRSSLERTAAEAAAAGALGMGPEQSSGS